MAGVERSPLSGIQFRAIGWLRWRLFINSFRRKGGKGELVARIVLLPFVAMIAIGPIVGAGAAGFYALHNNAPWMLSLMTWLVFAGWVFVTSSMTLQPSTVDLSLLLRFPLRFRSYVLIRFVFGLLSPPNVIGSLALLMAAIGIGLAEPRLFGWAALVLFAYGLMIILLLRMVLQWLERWLAQRRSREIVGLVFTVFFLAIQYFNVRMQTWTHSHRHQRGGFAIFAALTPYYHAIQPVIGGLPPTLAAKSILLMRAGAASPATECLAGVIVYAFLFAAFFSLRLRGEFRGENFNEAPVRSAAKHSDIDKGGLSIGGVSPAVMACIEKELRYLMRGPSMLLGILTPLVLVGLYVNRMGSSEMLLPGAMAYVMFSLLPSLYNVLGQDAAGAQMYLLSPTPIRLVFLAKNIVGSALIVVVAGCAAALVIYSHPPSAPILLGTAIWFVFVLLTNLSFGNYRSIQSPVKVDMGKIQRREKTSQVSTLIVLGVLFGSLVIGFALLFGFRYIGYVWAAPVTLLVMATVAGVAYVRTLDRIEGYILTNRDVLIEVLGKGATS